MQPNDTNNGPSVQVIPVRGGRNQNSSMTCICLIHLGKSGQLAVVFELRLPDPGPDRTGTGPVNPQDADWWR